MFKTFCTVIILGMAARISAIRKTPQHNKDVCDLAVLVQKEVTKDGVTNTEKTWYKVTCWEGLADKATKMIQAGDYIYVQGILNVSKWKGNDGQPQMTL